VDAIQNEAFLKRIHDLLSSIGTGGSAGVWASLTDEQRERVLKAYEASAEDANLRPADEVFGKHRP
jgi:dihydrodipicolinate synthase/N-acetylneuraminate lyase